jgi:hypothetical protein
MALRQLFGQPRYRDYKVVGAACSSMLLPALRCGRCCPPILPPASPIPGSGGADRDRTGDLLNANQALSQLSYSPVRSNSPPWPTSGWLVALLARLSTLPARGHEDPASMPSFAIQSGEGQSTRALALFTTLATSLRRAVPGGPFVALCFAHNDSLAWLLSLGEIGLEAHQVAALCMFALAYAITCLCLCSLTCESAC